MKIPFFDYPKLYTDDKQNYLKIFDEVSSRGAFILQKDVIDFEKNICEFTRSKYTIGVGNATDGLEIAWSSIGLRPGDEVIVSSHTMLATASAIKVAGGIPIPVDIGEDNLIDIEAIEEAINPRTVGIMPTDLNGRTCEMDKIMEIAKKEKLYVVEDAAQALGSLYKGQHAGTFGDAAAISFFPAKVLGCFGDAGCILTNSEVLYHRAYQMHDHGRNPNGDVKSWGRNSRLDNLQAAFLNYNLKSYYKVISRRRVIAGLYESKLKEIKEISLPPGPDNNGAHFDIYQNYELIAENRNELKEYLSSKGIGTLVQWGGKGVHQWESLGFNQILPKVERFFEGCIMLPMNMFITDKDINYISETIKDFYANNKP